MPDIPVVILCGGKGKRMLPITEQTPKVLALLNGKPLIQHVIDLYEKKGFKNFTLCVGHKADLIQNYFEGKTQHNVAFSNAGEEASMLQRLWLLKDSVKDTTVVSYGDTITNIDINALLHSHRITGALLTILVGKIKSPFGLVERHSDGFASSFLEKPVQHYYLGHFVIEPRAFDYITPSMLVMPDGEGLVSFFHELINKKKVNVYEHNGFQLTFNTEPERQKAEQELSDFYTYRED